MISDFIGYTVTDQPWLQTLLFLAILVLVAMLGNWIAKQVVLKIFGRLLTLTPHEGEQGALTRIARRLSNLVPALIIQAGIVAVPNLPSALISLVQAVATGFMILTVAMAISAALDFANEVYNRRPDAGSRPIKGYLQVGKIIVYFASAILIIAALIDKSPLLLLSGLGAMAAVLMLVFKDTILSLVASVQLSSNDMLRVGDWIEMPQLGADGDVVDIALHTVKVQNWDKTITTIPTHRLISESFRNWRGMYEAGGRRIKRSLTIDQNSIRFLEPSEVERLRRFSLLSDYLAGKETELAEWNQARPERTRDAVNARRITNIGTFRAYVSAYLKARGDLSDKLFLLVRQLAPSETGLPLEIYAFTASTAWADHEGTQADIFDHLIAILPEFGLRLFQQPTGLDFAAGLGQVRRAA
ncbi:mechanosensitive ion channel family protein [Sphingosinicella humi]